MHRIKIIDSHAGGEPKRLMIRAFFDLDEYNMPEQRALLAWAAHSSEKRSRCLSL